MLNRWKSDESGRRRGQRRHVSSLTTTNDMRALFDVGYVTIRVDLSLPLHVSTGIIKYKQNFFHKFFFFSAPITKCFYCWQGHNQIAIYYLENPQLIWHIFHLYQLVAYIKIMLYVLEKI